MNTSHLRASVAGFALVALAGLTLSLIAWTTASANQPVAEQAQHVNPGRAVYALLPALGRNASTADAIPARARAAINASGHAASIDFGAARAVGPDHQQFVVPSQDGFCVGQTLSRGSASYCSTSDALLNHLFVGAVMHDEGGFVLSGILGAGAADASVLADGARNPLDIVDGAVAAQLAVYPSAISWTDGDGTSRTQTFAAPAWVAPPGPSPQSNGRS